MTDTLRRILEMKLLIVIVHWLYISHPDYIICMALTLCRIPKLQLLIWIVRVLHIIRGRRLLIVTL